jgi:hypothetical protein
LTAVGIGSSADHLHLRAPNIGAIGTSISQISFFESSPNSTKRLDSNLKEKSFSVDRNFHNQLTEIFDAFQLIEKFDQVPKNNFASNIFIPKSTA